MSLDKTKAFLEKAIEGLQDEINQLEKTNFILDGAHANIRTQTAIEDLFDNLDYIAIEDLETFINTHKKI